MINLRLAFRTLFRTPFVTIVAVASLALGIGGNSAIFSLTNQVLFRRLPVPEPGRLINLSAPGPNPGSQSCNQAGGCDEIFSYPMFADLVAGQTAVQLAGHRAIGVNLAVRGEPLSGEAMLVSGSYFGVLRLAPVHGRLIGPDDDAQIGTGYVAVLTYDFWNSRFNADPAAVGQTVVVNGKTVTIIGVAPRGFHGTTLGTTPHVFMPLTMRGELTGFTGYQNRRSYWVYAFGRLAEGRTMEQAHAELNARYAPILSDAEAPLQEGMSPATMERFKAKQISVAPGFRGQSSTHREARTPLFMLLGVTGVVLLIACANVANLLLAKGAGRAQEMGTRLALGASRGRLVAQLLTESVLLSLLGGAASIGVARVTLGALARLLPDDAASVVTLTLQPSVFIFALLTAVLTGVLFGLFPALHSTRSDLIEAIRAGAGQISGHRGASRFRSALVTVQITLATGLLISAGLFLRSLVNVSRVDLGVQVDDVVTFSLSPRRSGYDTLAAGALYRRLEESLAGLPGITGVTSGMVPLIAGSNWGTDVHVQGFPVGPDVDNNSSFNEVGAGYFRMLGIPILAGRDFTASDELGGPRVAIVNQAFARKFNLGANPVGTFMSYSGPDSLTIEIVGLAQDAKYSDVKDSIPAVFFLPWRQDGSIGSLYFYARTPVEPAGPMQAIATLARQMAPTVPVEELQTMPDQIRENVFLDRLISILSAVFASLATLLAAVGLYGVLAYTVQQRTREIGVRMALGANAGRVRLLVLRQIGLMIGIGGVLGIGLALALGQLLRSQLYGLEGNDPVVFATSLTVLGLVALGAVFVPVRRAVRVNPVEALRYE